jgi:hypothetical protein
MSAPQIRWLISLTCFLATVVSGQTGPAIASDEHLAPIASLVGGEWRAQLPPAANGAKMSIVSHCGWSANHRSIRFDNAFVTDEKPSPYTDGAYSWNPVKKQIGFVYTDAEGSLTEGVIAIEKTTLIYDFTIAKENGQTEKARAIITPHGADKYSDDVFLEKNGRLKKIVSVTYERGPNEAAAATK